MTSTSRSLLERATLIVCGASIGIGCVEIALRATAWVLLPTSLTMERPILQDARQYRILCVGESTTGDLVIRRQSYPRQLERILNRAGGVGFTVTNAGLPAKTTLLLLSGQAAWQQIIDGHQTEAEVLLRRLVEQEEWSVAKSRADGMMAVLNWQRDDDQEAERYHQRFLEAERHIPRTRTVRNYQRMRRILADRSIPLIAVQYPALPTDMLKHRPPRTDPPARSIATSSPVSSGT